MSKANFAPMTAHTVFEEYKQHIINEFLEKYGRSYATASTVLDTWRQTTPYSREIEYFLIDRTNLFIRLMDASNGKARNLEFLDKLTDLMVEYLAEYTGKEKNRTNQQAREDLKQKLYHQSPYIMYLREHHAAKHAKHMYFKHQHEEEIRRMEQAKNIRKGYVLVNMKIYIK